MNFFYDGLKGAGQNTLYDCINLDLFYAKYDTVPPETVAKTPAILNICENENSDNLYVTL